VSDMDSYRRRALRKSIELLVSGQLLVVSPKAVRIPIPIAFLENRPRSCCRLKHGFAAIAAATEKRLHARLPIIPAGLRYKES
jgi:hypothetical protein